MEQIKNFFHDIVAYFKGNLYFYQDQWCHTIRKVYYRHDEEWGLHVFTIPSLDRSETVNDKWHKDLALDIVLDRLFTGLS